MQGEKVKPTAASVAAEPYFQLQANAPGGEAILILAGVERGQLAWYGSAHDIVFTRDGLLVKTVGLPQNLDSTMFPSDNPFRTGLQQLHAPLEYTRRMDWSPGYRYGVVMHARLEPGALEDVEILGSVRHLRRVDEHLSAPGMHMTNHYWVDPVDGFIWKSKQYATPDYPLELIQLRPYREAAPVDNPVTAVYPSKSRLSSVALAAKVEPDAYMLGAAWLQPELKEEQLRLRAGVAYELGAIRRQAIGSDNQPLAEAGARFQAWLSEQPITGRHPAVPLDPARLEVTPADDWPVHEGDTLFYPRRPSQIRVVGAVNKACSLAQVPMQDARRYLAACPVSAAADPDMIYVVQPDGAVFEQDTALWNRAAPRPLAPGAWIYVPFNRRAIAGAADDGFNRDVADFLATQILNDQGWR
jgi:hypothetical protein